MRILFSICLSILIISPGKAQYTGAPYRLYGEISTVENQTYRGFITWGKVKNYWIDFFEATKPQNPYSSYFEGNDILFFQTNGQSSTKPPTHIFCCRFGNIQSIRPTAEKEIMLELKNGRKYTLIKGNSPDINTDIQILTSTENIIVKWDHISEIHFMAADNNALPQECYPVAGIVKSSQGLYKGLIYWNSNKKQDPDKNKDISIFLNKMQKVTRKKGTTENHSLEYFAKKEYPKISFANSNFLPSLENVTINMPNIGSVTVPFIQFDELTVIPISELNLLSYTDFTPSLLLSGEVISRSGDHIIGQLAYDLDENLNIEVLDGKNDNIYYKIPFQYIFSIEPKNYKYSFITLKNGHQLSLGDAPDVNRENSGIIISGDYEIPFYIPWNEVKKVIIQ